MVEKTLEALKKLSPQDFSKVNLLYPRFKANTPEEFVNNIGDDEKSLQGVLNLCNKQLGL